VSWLRGLLFETCLGLGRPWRPRFEQLSSWVAREPEEIREIQDRLLGDLLVHAIRHVPYYRRLLGDHPVARALESAGATGRRQLARTLLVQIPPLDRPTLRREFDQLRSNDLAHRSWRVDGTGGSTGQPVRFIVDREHGLWRFAAEHLFDGWAGVVPGMRRMRLWGSARQLGGERETIGRRLYRWRRNERSLDSFRMTSSQMRRHAARLNQWRPGHLIGYADSLHAFARFLERSGLAVVAPASIMSSSGTLFPEHRRIIERVFGAPVFDRYAAREVGAIAAEDAAHEGLVVPPLHLVEIIRPDGSPAPPGEEGEILVTCLTNHAMPLLRYRIGDTGAMAPRPSTRTGWPVLQHVTGRVAETFVRADGGLVSSLSFIHLAGVVLQSDWIRRWQVVQEEPKRITVRLVLEPPLTRDAPEFVLRTGELAAAIRRTMGEECTVEFRVEREIPPLPNGKYCYCASRVTSPAG